ncbi:hypothetical protein V8G54_009737 [Vigna mungo]|uniref:Retrotransposon Copia-like N-terminal domain-containing protein n=1 Tax=Vigna mungo TaxID=3915 RepID=A0AAQ3NV33_VIGMU
MTETNSNSTAHSPEFNPNSSAASDPSLVPSSPFYIHPSEGPSSVSITPVLIENNYHSWSHSFRMALISKNKMGFLMRSILVPSPKDISYHSWEHCNTLIMSWLLNSLSSSIAQSVIFFDRAIDIWVDLRERFSQGDLQIGQLSKRVDVIEKDKFRANTDVNPKEECKVVVSRRERKAEKEVIEVDNSEEEEEEMREEKNIIEIESREDEEEERIEKNYYEKEEDREK